MKTLGNQNKRGLWIACLLCVAWLAGCSDTGGSLVILSDTEQDTATTPDTNQPDTGEPDTGEPDTSESDTGPLCTDSQRNGQETATDCGGGDCPACADGQACAAPSDCASGVCFETLCGCPENFVPDQSGGCTPEGGACDPNPCQNAGACAVSGDTFVCDCADGFEGDTCETNTDDCTPNPCLNGGTCTDGTASFSCECATGFTGADCGQDVDECAADPTVCGDNATCTDEEGSFTCACNVGFADDGQGACIDIDECTDGLDDCDPNATCTNTEGTFECACNADYVGDGKTCVVALDCALGETTCDANATCTDTGSGSFCMCNTGYSGDGVTCADTDECAGAPCFAGVVCTDVVAPGTGFTCDPCPTGYSGDGITCTDTDECAGAPCFTGVACTDVVAPGTGFTCDPCPTGYTGDGITCVDTDDCAGAPCFTGVTCTDTPAPGTGFSCAACPTGYTGDGIVCIDTDECAGAPCFTGVVCTDVVAPGTGFTCAACPTGYSGDGITCIDTDECASAPCFAGVACTDTPAPGTGFTCAACPTGYTGDGITCIDTDECAGAPCFAGVICTDTPAPGIGFTCGACPTGYTGDGITCVDTDGCAGAPCFTGVACTDVVAPGTGFTCAACPTGYSGDGITCTDNDECVLNTDNCDTNATCTNNPGSFSCACNPGYAGTGVTCAPAQIEGAKTDADPGRWTDGTFAVSCSAYRFAVRPYLYAGTIGSGVYRIDPDGVGTGTPFNVYCDMTTSGGGWTLAFLKNSVHSGNYDGFCSTQQNLTDLVVTPDAASSNASSTAARRGWLNLNTGGLPYDTLRLSAHTNGARQYMSNDIRRSSLRINFGQDGYLLHNDPNGYFWCGGRASYTDAGTGQVNQPTGAPADCKNHGSLGSGWDFSNSGTVANTGLTMCGIDNGSNWMYGGFATNQVFYPTPGAAQAIWVRNDPSRGNGQDGTPTFTGTTQVNVNRANVSGTTGTSTVSLANTVGTFRVGDMVLVHQTRGTGAGAYEINHVVAVAGTTVTLATPLQATYSTASGANRAQMVVVPQYVNVTVPAGATLTSAAWDGNTGGILAFVATGTVNVQGTVHMNANGFLGVPNQNVSNQTGDQGEGHVGPSAINTVANGNGGGGGLRVSACECCWAGTGGGGGHAAAGTAGGAAPGAACQTGGAAGAAVGNAQQLTALFFGGAGAQGGADEDGQGSAGANGGGLIYTAATNLTVAATGTISANGAAGAPELNTTGCGSGGGGGGAGGAIFAYVAGTATLNTGRITSTGGAGGDDPLNCGGAGGAGSVGRISVRGAATTTGTTTPAFTAVP